jgi:hypothetical protein
MKKLLWVLACSVILSSALFARESEYFYVNVNIEKIFPYRKGYIVQYRKGADQLATVYLPLEWFTEIAGKGELVGLQAPTAWPYMSVFYKNGEFSHVKLYIRTARSHESWGNVPLNVNVDDRFENVTDVKIEY